MFRTSLIACAAVVVLTTAVAAGPQLQAPAAGPPMPYEDVGACPFECCTYREWTANAAVTVRADRRSGAPTVFTVATGDRIRAITGVVVTTRPGRVRFRKPVNLQSASGAVHVEPGETLYLLTYHGEGFTTAWFKGRLLDELDGSEFFNAACEFDANACNGTIIERPRQTWWVRVQSLSGQRGWTSEPEKFDDKDACG